MLTCLHQVRQENQRLESTIAQLSSRRDQLLAINARLTHPLPPLNVHTNSTPVVNSHNTSVDSVSSHQSKSPRGHALNIEGGTTQVSFKDVFNTSHRPVCKKCIWSVFKNIRNGLYQNYGPLQLLLQLSQGPPPPTPACTWIWGPKPASAPVIKISDLGRLGFSTKFEIMKKLNFSFIGVTKKTTILVELYQYHLLFGGAVCVSGPGKLQK